MQKDIYAAVIPIDPTMLACTAIIVAVALTIQLITHLYKLRIVILKERKRKTAEIPFLLGNLNNLGKESDDDKGNNTMNASKNFLLPTTN